MTFKQSEETLTNRHGQQGPCKTKVFKVKLDIGHYIVTYSDLVPAIANNWIIQQE